MHTEDNRDLNIIDELVDDLVNNLDNLGTTYEDNKWANEDYVESVRFHYDHIDMFNKEVKLTLKDETIIKGLYNDESYEDSSIVVDGKTVKICDIECIELVNR